MLNPKKCRQLFLKNFSIWVNLVIKYYQIILKITHTNTNILKVYEMYIRQEKIRFGNTVSFAFFHLASCLGMTCKEGINSTRKGKEKILKMTIYKHFLKAILPEGKSQSQSAKVHDSQRLSDCEGLLQLIVVACDCMWPQSVIGFASPFCSGGLF